MCPVHDNTDSVLADREKPYHLQGPRILQSYETNLIRGKRTYDSRGPQRLVSQVLTVDFSTGIR